MTPCYTVVLDLFHEDSIVGRFQCAYVQTYIHAYNGKYVFTIIGIIMVWGSRGQIAFTFCLFNHVKLTSSVVCNKRLAFYWNAEYCHICTSVKLSVNHFSVD